MTTNASNLLQSLVVYSICLPLALLIGYLLAQPADYGSLGFFAILLLLLLVPIILRYHHLLLTLAWNGSMVVFLLPGRPNVWLPAVALSLSISIIARTLLPRYRFISAPEVTRPLIVLGLVVLVTAEATGGIGVHGLGGQVYGGHHYVLLLGGILGYFALTAHRIPARRAYLYLGLFFFSSFSAVIGDFAPLSHGATRYIFLFFPPNMELGSEAQLGVSRFMGVGAIAKGVFCFMLAKYGIRGIFLSGKPMRVALFIAFPAIGLLGGFRSLVLVLFLIFAVQFWLEGLHRTRLLLVAVLGLAVAGPLALAFSQHLPRTFQRALAFLPVNIDPAVRIEAETSSEWRKGIWKELVPQIPGYLMLGKGYAIRPEDLEATRQFQKTLADTAYVATMSGDYHSGPLSVIITFGLWGAAAFTWFVIAALRALYFNYRYGDPQLLAANRFLLAIFIAQLLMFVFVVGGLHIDMQILAGYVGLGISLNGGIRRPVRAPVVEKKPVPIRVRPMLRPAHGLSR